MTVCPALATDRDRRLVRALWTSPDGTLDKCPRGSLTFAWTSCLNTQTEVYQNLGLESAVNQTAGKLRLFNANDHHQAPG